MKNLIVNKSMVFAIFFILGSIIAPSINCMDNQIKIKNQICELSSFDPFENGWSYRKSITINHNLVSSDLTDFPVLISITDIDLSLKAQSDGDDILFMDGSGDANILSYEIERYDHSNGVLVAWVKIPYLSGNVDTVFYMYYGNPSCGSQQDPGGVWDSNFLHVWHLGSSLVDSAGPDGGTNHGTNLAIGKIGEARDFERDDGDYVDLGDMDLPCNDILTTGTLEFWVNAKELGQRHFIATKYDTTGTDYQSYAAWIEASGKLGIMFYHQNYDNWFKYVSNNVEISIDTWYYVAFQITIGSTRVVNIFVDGENVLATKYTQGSQPTTFKDIPKSDKLGAAALEISWEYSDAIIDETRWSWIVRSGDWIKTSHNTMNNPSSFFDVGPEEQSENQPPNPPSNPNPPDGALDVSISAILSWYCSDPDGDELTYDVYFGTNSNPPLVSAGQSQNYYDPPGSMNENTQYFWKIVAEDEQGESSAGPVWTFTTGLGPNNPPNTPSEPLPPDGASDIEIDTSLSWSGGDPDGDEVVYDVFLEAYDNTPDVLLSNNQEETIFYPGPLKTGTPYFWRIVAKDEYGDQAIGPVWSFTTSEETVNNPPITPIVGGPTSGKTGASILISAISADPDNDKVYYWFDWGDNSNTGWVGPYDSGVTVKESHIWDNEGVFHIKVKAMDVYDSESSWGSFDISIPRTRTSHYPIWLSFLERFPLFEKIRSRMIIFL
jgi:hypothetical protein